MSRYPWDYILSSLFLNSSMTVLAHYYFRQFSDAPLRQRWLLSGLLCLTGINLGWFLPVRQFYFYSFTIVLYFMYLLYARLVFRFRWQESILYAMLYYFLTHFIVRTVSRLSVQILGYHFMEPGTSFPILLAYDLLILIPSVGMVLLFQSKLRPLAGYCLSPQELLHVILLGIPLISCCHSQYLMKVDYLHFPVEIVLMRDVISLCAVYALTGIISFNKSKAEQLEVQKIQGLLEKQYEQFRLKQESSERILEKCHDLQKQLRLFQMTNQSAYIESYQKELQKTIRDYDSLYETGNAVIDTLLSDAGLNCLSNGIQLICLLDGRDFDFISPMDLCTIFGNALDNAIESARQIEDPEKRIIHVKVSRDNSFLILHFDNYYEHRLNWQDGELKTSKAEKKDHGYGLKSIRYAAQKYGGQVMNRTQDGRFILTIIFPAKI